MKGRIEKLWKTRVVSSTQTSQGLPDTQSCREEAFHLELSMILSTEQGWTISLETLWAPPFLETLMHSFLPSAFKTSILWRERPLMRVYLSLLSSRSVSFSQSFSLENGEGQRVMHQTAGLKSWLLHQQPWDMGRFLNVTGLRCPYLQNGGKNGILPLIIGSL